TLACAVGVLDGQVLVRPMDHAGQHRRLDKVELLDTLLEVRGSGGAYSMDRQGTVLPEVDSVQIRLEDFRLAVASLEGQGEQGFAELARPRAPGADIEALDELLRQRAAALHDLAPTQVCAEGTEDRPHVHPNVFKEP